MKQLLFSLLILFLIDNPVNGSKHHPQVFLKAIQGSKHEGMQIYDHFCVNCHDKNPLIPLGAPRFQVESDWSWRLKHGAINLFQHTDQGINAMPPRGGCFECTDEQLILAIVAMLPQKSKKDILINLKDHKKYK